MKPGKVYLVGAGPGHPELLTVKAAALLQSCDVIVYDRLVQEEVLSSAKPSAERIFMGKAPGRHESRQDEILQLLARKAREGKVVVRLKGGDPFVFGRGGEEVQFLADEGIAFEVIPGVSSALAAPLGAGIPVTHRDVASSLAIVTGHEAAREHDRTDWGALARIDTLVFLMAVSNVEAICRRLIANGRPPDTPAAMIQMAYWHDERVVTARLDSIADAVARAGIVPPATLVVGRVVALRDRMQPANRDLRRHPDDDSRFAPAPGADQLLALATGAVASQVLGFGLAVGAFDWLEQPRTSAATADRFGFPARSAAELLNAWASMGLIEETSDGYRNLEIASRYLTARSAQSLRVTLLDQISLSTSWAAIATYTAGNGTARAGHASCGPASYDALARFVAPAVVERIDLGRAGRVLHIGSGAAAYADAVARRWPGVSFVTIDPASPAPGAANGDGPFGSVLLSDVFSAWGRDEIDRALAVATTAAAEDAVLILHDSFVPAGGFPPLQIVLGAFARQVAASNGGTWSEAGVVDRLERLGWTTARVDPVIAGSLLVTAKKRAGP